MLAVTLEDHVRAYPVESVRRREVLNDAIHGRPVVVVFCDSCNVGMAYSARQADRELTFEAAGMRDDAEVMRDKDTGTVWTQLSGSALEGPLAGESLEMYGLESLTSAEYKERHPGAEILSE